VEIAGHIEPVIEPIKNIATGGSHRAQAALPDGMEYKVTETATTTVNRAKGKISYGSGRAPVTPIAAAEVA
jgi:hypothetical protein